MQIPYSWIKGERRGGERRAMGDGRKEWKGRRI